MIIIVIYTIHAWELTPQEYWTSITVVRSHMAHMIYLQVHAEKYGNPEGERQMRMPPRVSRKRLQPAGGDMASIYRIQTGDGDS